MPTARRSSPPTMNQPQVPRNPWRPPRGQEAKPCNGHAGSSDRPIRRSRHTKGRWGLVVALKGAGGGIVGRPDLCLCAGGLCGWLGDARAAPRSCSRPLATPYLPTARMHTGHPGLFGDSAAQLPRHVWGKMRDTVCIASRLEKRARERKVLAHHRFAETLVAIGDLHRDQNRLTKRAALGLKLRRAPARLRHP